MRNAKLWSVLLAAVLLVLCIAGVLFTGASASETRIPTATATYVVGTDGDTIRACLDKAAGETWAANTVLKIQFDGEDSSAYSAPNAAEGISGYTLFETATIFREDDTQLPIVIEGTAADKAALIKTEKNSYHATNDYYFTNLTMNGGVSSESTVSFYAGSGSLTFENCKFNNYVNTYYYGDCQATDAWEGWDAAKVAANSNAKGLVETGVTFGNGCTGLFTTGGSGQHYSAVGYNGNAETNPTIFALKRAKASATAALTEDEVKAVQEAAPLATYKQGNVVTIEDCVVKPWNTATYLIIDLGTVATIEDTVPDIGMAGARNGVSPVRDARIELISGGCQYISAGASVSGTNETYAGDTTVIMRGGRSGRQSGLTGSYYSDVGIRLSNLAMFVGDLTLEIHEDDPAVPTYTPWIQTSQSAATSTVFGNYHFLMTGGTIGDGTHGNDGYWGAPVATGTIVNEVQGGKIWAFYGSRYANSNENTPVSTQLPGVDTTLSTKVTVHNKISGGEFGALVSDAVSSTKGFHGQGKGSVEIASVCNEITGGTFYWFNGASSATGTAPGDIYNFISGTKEVYPTFLSHFHGTRSTVTTPSVTNVIKGYPVFQSLDGVKLNIYGGCANGTVTKIDNYLGGMPVFDDFYGGVSGTSSGKGIAGDITNTIALDMTTSVISNYVWGGNGYYHTVEDEAASTKGHSSSAVTGSITCNIYSAYFGTYRCDSAAGADDVCPMTTNIYGGKWSSNFTPIARNFTRGKNTSETPADVVTNNIYGGTFNYCYMGGQNPNDREIVNNVYGGTFNKNYFGGGGSWAKKVTNNIYGGTFKASYYGGGGAYSTSTETYSGCGSEAVVNNIYGGTFSDSHEYMGAYSNPTNETYLCETQTIENNFYGGDLGKNWLYCGPRNGTVGSITNHFYSGEDNPVRDPENELYKYFDAEGKTTTEAGTYLRDQVVCGLGYSESLINTNRADSITNTFEGGGFVTGKGGTNITIHGGMRWGIVGDVTNNFIAGEYYRVFGGCDYGYVTGTITNNYGSELEEGAEAPALSFSGYTYGGGMDQTNDLGKYTTEVDGEEVKVQIPAKAFSVRIAEAVAAQEALDAAVAAGETGTALTAAQEAWYAIYKEFGADFAGGAKYIVNNIYYSTFHQFYGGSNGSVAEATESVSHIDTITNNVYGGTFNKLGTETTVYAGGCFRNAVIATGIVNNVSGGTFNGNWYGGSVGIGTVSCPSITNTFNGGTGNKSANAYVYFGNGAPTYNGTVKTEINDFDAGRSYVVGGSAGIHNQPEGVEYGIETTINGGTFCGFWGLGGGSSCEYTGNIKTTVNGGTFKGYASTMPNSLAGGPRNGTLVGNIELIINDGIFTADVVGGTIWGDQDAACETITGNVKTTVKGGDFQGNIYALSRYSEALKATGEVLLNVEQTAGVALKFGGEAIIDSFVANGETIEIGADTNLEVKALTGEISVHQTEGWEAHDYLKLPAGSQYVIVNDARYGSYTEDDTILVKGVAIVPVGATIRLAERLGVRIVLDANDVEAYGDVFTYVVKMGDTVLAEGGYEEIKVNGYSILFDGIGLSQFDDKFTVTSPLMADLETSIVDLAVIAQTAWKDNDKWKAYADAIVEFNNVYNNDAANTMTPDAVTLVPVAAKGEADGIAGANVTLLMADAAGIRLTVTLDAVPENAKILVNGEEVTKLVKVDGETITADLYFAHEYLAEEFVVSVESDAGVHMTYTTSIEALANVLANDDANENKKNATAFLVYIQKAVACK